MRLINSFQFKQMLLEDRNMLVPKTVNDPFAQAVRYGFHRALRCMEQCATIRAEPVKHGRWIEEIEVGYDGSPNGCHFKCSLCNEIDYETTPYCPNCGAKMQGGNKDG